MDEAGEYHGRTWPAELVRELELPPLPSGIPPARLAEGEQRFRTLIVLGAAPWPIPQEPLDVPPGGTPFAPPATTSATSSPSAR